MGLLGCIKVGFIYIMILNTYKQIMYFYFYLIIQLDYWATDLTLSAKIIISFRIVSKKLAHVVMLDF